jgi:hypothetical protein
MKFPTENRGDDSPIKERIRKEQERTLAMIAGRDERPATAFWLSFAGDDGFHGAVIVHAEDFVTAVMECNWIAERILACERASQ